MSAPADAGANEDDPLDWSDKATHYMRDGSYEEARWNRVLIQTGAGLGLFLLVLVATRAWTSYAMTWRARPGRHYPKQFDVVIGVVDIIASVGSLCCFIARTYIRVSNPGVRWFEVCLALFYFLAMWRRLWLKNFDVGVAFTMSTFLAGPPPPAPSPFARTVPVYPRTLAASSSLASHSFPSQRIVSRHSCGSSSRPSSPDSFYVAAAVCQVASGLPTWLMPSYIRAVSALIRYEVGPGKTAHNIMRVAFETRLGKCVGQSERILPGPTPRSCCQRGC